MITTGRDYLNFIMNDTKKKDELFILSTITNLLDKKVFDFCITAAEPIYDEENDECCVGITFNRGTSDYQVCLSTYGSIKAYHPKTPKTLLVEIGNIITNFYTALIYTEQD